MHNKNRETRYCDYCEDIIEPGKEDKHQSKIYDESVCWKCVGVAREINCGEGCRA